MTYVASSYANLETATYTCSAGTPLVSEYANNSTSKLLSPTNNHRLGATIYNGTASKIACFLTYSGTTFPNRSAGLASEEAYIAPSQLVSFPNLTTTQKIFCRSTTAASITSGDILLSVW